ncbi:MAG: hypothetical protein GY828_08035 [Candidatus Gracilibacteria bacterium]|nr:hypothetical protein [Candidatus Gracilibacteria bacterium]
MKKKVIVILLLSLGLISCGNEISENTSKVNKNIAAENNNQGNNIGQNSDPKSEGVQQNKESHTNEIDSISDQNDMKKLLTEKLRNNYSQNTSEQKEHLNHQDTVSDLFKITTTSGKKIIVYQKNNNSFLLQLNEAMYSIEGGKSSIGNNYPIISSQGDILIAISNGDNTELYLNGKKYLTYNQDNFGEVFEQKENTLFLKKNGEKIELEELTKSTALKSKFYKRENINSNDYKHFIFSALSNFGEEYYKTLDVKKIITNSGKEIYIYKNTPYRYLIHRDGKTHGIFGDEVVANEIIVSVEGDIIIVLQKGRRMIGNINGVDTIILEEKNISPSMKEENLEIGLEKRGITTFVNRVDGKMFINIDGKSIEVDGIRPEGNSSFTVEKAKFGEFKSILKD